MTIKNEELRALVNFGLPAEDTVVYETDNFTFTSKELEDMGVANVTPSIQNQIENALEKLWEDKDARRYIIAAAEKKPKRST